MKKRLLLPTLALCTALSACGGSKSAEQTTAVVETTEAVTTVPTEETTEAVEETRPQSDISLKEIEGWLIGDIWNEGFCDFYHYEEDGKSSLGETIDIDFALSRFKKNYEKKAEYDAYINSLPDSYDSIKETWNKLSVEMDKLYDYYKDGVTQSGILLLANWINTELDNRKTYTTRKNHVYSFDIIDTGKSIFILGMVHKNADK